MLKHGKAVNTGSDGAFVGNGVEASG